MLIVIVYEHKNLMCDIFVFIALALLHGVRVNTHQLGFNLRRRAWNRLLMKRQEDNFEDDEGPPSEGGRGGVTGESVGGQGTASEE